MEAATVVECGGGSNNGGRVEAAAVEMETAAVEVEAAAVEMETAAVKVETAAVMDWRLRQQQWWLGGGGDNNGGLKVEVAVVGWRWRIE